MTDRKYITPFEILHAVSLLSQKERIRKFDLALEQIIKPGMSVADIGTGTGVLAMLAAKHGASKITAIDINRASIEYAKQVAHQNNLDSRIDFQVGHFTDLQVDDKYDIVLCEMLSSIMLIEQQIPAVNYINKHLLKESGFLLPSSIRTFGILCQADKIMQRFQYDSFKFISMPQTVSQNERIELSEIELIFKKDLQTCDDDFIVNAEMRFHVTKNGIAHGITGMFDARLHGDIVLEMENGWRELFIPFDKAVEVQKGEEITINLHYKPGEPDSLQIEYQ